MNYRVFVALILTGGILIIADSIYTGIEKRDIVVAEDAYTEGVHFDETLKKHKELGWSVALPAAVRQGTGKLAVVVSGKDGNALEGAELAIEANPMGSPEVRTCRCSDSGKGNYEAAVALDRKGYWDITVKVSLGKETLKFANKLNVEG